MMVAQAGHAPAMAAIHAASFPPPERWGVDAMALQLGQPGAFGLIDPAGGFLLARVAADEAEILTVAVAPEARRKGLARALLEAAAGTAASRGARRLFLEVATTNAAARALYAGCGFAEIGRRPRYYPGGGDALVLARDVGVPA
ncbi:MAG: GNAT family N-acetyltransferase [Rhodospirillales bacterium]|nr:GNAT family N-acetyltransferase [Rhodospirillales bacterium]